MSQPYTAPNGATVTQQVAANRYRVEQQGLPVLYVDTSVLINGRWLVECRFGLPINLDEHAVRLARSAVQSYLESVREGVGYPASVS